MNQGRRRIRYTVIAVAGLTVVMVGAARLHASTVDAGTPQWLRSVMTLGMAVSRKETITAESLASKLPRAMTLDDIRDFTRISVEGDFSVEVVGAPQYKVSLNGVSAEKWALDWGMQSDGLVRIKGGAGTEGGVLRVETPTLVSIEATGLRQLTVRGVEAPELSLQMKDLTGVRLEENNVGSWIFHSETPVVVQAEGIRTSAGLRIQASGHITINGPGAQIVNVRGGTSKVSIHTSK